MQYSVSPRGVAVGLLYLVSVNQMSTSESAVVILFYSPSRHYKERQKCGVQKVMKLRCYLNVHILLVSLALSVQKIFMFDHKVKTKIIIKFFF